MKKQVSKTKNETTVTFSISAELLAGAKKAFVAGTFNNWSTTETPFKITKGAGSAKVVLQSGCEYQYKFVVDNNWIDDPEADKFVNNEFGGTNSVICL